MFDPARLVFIDETATSTNMVRLRGRCPRGERLIDHVPHGHWKTITFVAGLRRRAMVAPLVLDGPMNATIFLAYLEQCLVPELKRGDIVMMDSLPVHKVAACTRGHRSSRREATLSAQIFAGPQPDRASLQQTQGASTKSCRANHSAPLPQDRRACGRIQPARMHQLLPPCRLRFYVTGIRSSAPPKPSPFNGQNWFCANGY